MVVPALCSKEVVAPEIINKIHGILLDDRRIIVLEMAEAVCVSSEPVLPILHAFSFFFKSSVPSRQSTGAHVCSQHGKNP